MGRPKLNKEEDLLYLLNNIADLVIGNEDPVDVGFNERTTLPEMLSYIMVHPTNKKAVLEAERKLKQLSDMIDVIKNKVYVMKKKIALKCGE